MRYALPPDTQAEGIEGYRVATADGAELGHVAALNRTPQGLFVVVEQNADPEDLRPYPLADVEIFDDEKGTLVLREDAAPAAPEGPAVLVRYVPPELIDRARPGATASAVSGWWIVSLVLGILAAVSILAAHLVIESADSELAWAILIVPALLFAASGAALLTGIDAPLRDKLALVPASLLGYTPRSSRRR
jgi:hypothetical protein